MNSQPDFLHNIPHIRSSLDYLLGNDPVFSKLDPDFNDFYWPYYGPGFPGFVRIVAGQQVSTSAAKAIWNRVTESLNTLTPETIIQAGEQALRDCGFSRPKTRYILGAAEAIKNGAFDLDALSEKTDEGVATQITSLKGFGPWSAQIYLMFCLARPDIWPAGDLGIQEGLRKYMGREDRPDEKETLELGTKFKPHRTAASILLWYMKSNS